MQHLETERIAAFDHEPPTHEELSHLAACRLCRAERTALAELSERAFAAVNAVPSPALKPLTDWESLSVRLRAEGLLTSPPPAIDIVTPRQPQFTATELRFPAEGRGEASRAAIVPFDAWLERARPRTRIEWWRAAAAALLLLVGGGALGRLSAGASVIPDGGASSNVASAGVPLIGLGGGGFASMAEANRALTSAQRNYERAAIWLAANDTTTQSSDMVRRRLAALDQMVAASRAGLADAPKDPVLTHYYYEAYAMREATLRQLGGALPVGRSIERF